ncbi:DVU_1553 family AMP-dependent CoA ligase [Pleomorphomonas koreensis]|uniref:DVU_1553 family AMP-dependent CoA ligase n=1 Tax=Pleomorphomonas koreensis TaxID=257440 RepID=UPI00041378C6|nr:AMP-binding protein [Pleomorphomonas koreensis]
MTGAGTLDAWAGRRMALGHAPSRAEVETYRLDRLNAVIAEARARSPFYRSRRDWPADDRLATLADLGRLPFTCPDDLGRADPTLTALPLRDAARLVTIPTSGTSGAPKRIFFTEADIEATIDYFRRGMATLVRPGETVAVAFPTRTPGSVGDLLMRGLTRLDAEPLALPVDGTIDAVVAALRAARPTAIAGMPVTLGAAVRRSASDGGSPLRIETALVSADTISPSLRLALADLWGCEVFDHWGMTETGYGGALACHAHDGLHIRETDLHVEIVDPLTGRPVLDGTTGEIVLTTLTRAGQPLIRYRTGDLAAIDPRPCRCGSVLRRLKNLKGHAAGKIVLRSGHSLDIDIIDDAVFSAAGVIDFMATATAGPPVRLRLDIVAGAPSAVPKVRAALAGRTDIAAALAAGDLVLDIAEAAGAAWPICRKRRLRAPGSPSPDGPEPTRPAALYS